jgi:hypothetical protein
MFSINSEMVNVKSFRPSYVTDLFACMPFCFHLFLST